jgi:hypothetical protein
VETVLDLPVAALEAQEGGGIGPLGRQAGDEERHLDGGRPGRPALVDRGAVALDAAQLVDVGPAGLVGAGAADPVQDARMGDGPTDPLLPAAVRDGRGLDRPGQPPALVC